MYKNADFDQTSASVILRPPASPSVTSLGPLSAVLPPSLRISFGIQAARVAIMKELRGVIESNGSYLHLAGNPTPQLGRSTGRGVRGYGYGLPHCAPG